MEKSCGCIVFHDDKVLIVKSLDGFYGFPKGHVEGDETEFETAIRETLEETGVQVKIDSSERFGISYTVKNDVPKIVVYFMASVVGSSDIKVQEEELSDCFWIDISKVSEILSFDNLKNMWLDVYNVYREVYNG